MKTLISLTAGVLSPQPATTPARPPDTRRGLLAFKAGNLKLYGSKPTNVQKPEPHVNLLAWVLAPILNALTNLERKVDQLMSATQDAIDAITEQLGKAKDEILAKVSDLEAQVAAGETPDLEPLKAAAQALDDVVPDATTDQPPTE